MTRSRFLALAGLALALAGSPPSVPREAQPTIAAPEPHVGQKGKDVPWVPTSNPVVEKMLDLAAATKADFLMDLGSGDGRTVITAAKRGIRALGVEYEAGLVELSRRNAEREGVSGRARFVQADIFETDFSKATVITMFLLPDINLRLRPTILELEPGTRVVSNTFNMGDWEPDATAFVEESSGCDNAYCHVLMWIVPAKVEGTHQTSRGELRLEQAFQIVKGKLRSRDGKEVLVTGKVRGKEVILLAEGRELRGRVKGKALELD